MSAAVPPNGFRNALVLGGGGAVGLTWMAGVVAGLGEAGVDVTLADRIVGTSAGAITAAAVTGGVDPERLLNPPERPGVSGELRVNANGLNEILGELFALGLEPDEFRRRVGERALAASAGDPAEHIARMANLIGVEAWPERELLVTAVDATTGRRQVWTPGGKATLAEAVASSTSVPGVFPPIPIDGTVYIDGGLYSPVNADLAAGAEFMLIIEPLAHLFPRSPSDSELGGAATQSIAPDAAAIAAIGPNLFDPAAREPAFREGVRQGGEAAPRLKDVWPTA